MKKTFYLLAVAVIIITACQTKPRTPAVDREATKVAVSALMDKFKTAWRLKDTSLIALLTEDGLFCGTDPTEVWNKSQISAGWKQAFADTSLRIDYTIDKREMRIAADGNSAIVVDQLFMKIYSEKIPWRLVTNVVKKEESWMIDFMSWSFIPKNEDIEKLNKALE
jgi:ketosteroid isomerase-like protein